MFPPLFFLGKGDKRQIDPGHFIFFKYHTVPPRPEWPCHQVNLGTAQICGRDFSFEAMFSKKRAKTKTLSGSEVIGLQVVYPDDRIVCYALPQLNYN